MKKVYDMTNDQLLHWLNKTRKSIFNHAWNGGLSNSYRGYDLRDRYYDLSEEAKERIVDAKDHPLGWSSRTVWEVYCQQHGSSTEHDGYDLYA